MRPSDLQEATLLDLLLDDDRRALLAAALPGDLALTRRYDVVARRCLATPEQLRSLVARTALDRHDALLDPLVGHPAMPVDQLAALCDDDRCVSALGHLAGPRALLQQVIARHDFLEAIITVGLGLYRDPAVSLATFTDFLDAHRDCEPMLRALAQGKGSSPTKDDACLRLLADRPGLPAAWHLARHLLADADADVATLARALGAAPAAEALALLLRSPASEPAKTDLVVALCAGHPAREALLALYAEERAIARAADPALAPAEAAALFDAGDPRVLAALAGNARTPRPMLDVLATARGFPHAQTIRARAFAALRARRR